MIQNNFSAFIYYTTHVFSKGVQLIAGSADGNFYLLHFFLNTLDSIYLSHIYFYLYSRLTKLHITKANIYF